MNEITFTKMSALRSVVTENIANTWEKSDREKSAGIPRKL